ncbi:MAG TPA: nitroreductase family protein [Longimicrobiales bacterium]|nr:nitroreductase family protein [Longimicrobiales bacterium]
MAEARFVPLESWEELPPDEMLRRARAFRDELRRRRTVREFSERPVPRELVEACIEAAATAPSGANRQPWHFVAVGREDADLRRGLREAAEEEERRFYRERAPSEWLEALAHLGTDEHKPFLERAPWLIVVFAESWERGPGDRRHKNYYVTESVGIATGMLIAAVHRAGLVALTHTPSPMGFLGEILGRPDNERPFLVLVVGYPAEDARVPVIGKKPLDRIATFIP